MEILEKEVEGNTLKVVVESNEETLFSLMKVYLEESSDVDIVGFNKPHYLVDKTEFFLKTKKGNPVDVLKKALKEAQKDLTSKKVK